jgi:hypothetical protein
VTGGRPGRRLTARGRALTVLAPTLAPLELAGRKLLALFGRAEARDFADVYVLAQRFGKAELLAQAAASMLASTTTVLAQMMRRVDRFRPRRDPARPSQCGSSKSVLRQLG